MGETTTLRIGIDLGGTKTEAVALGPAGETLARTRVPTVRGDYAATLATVGRLVDELETGLGRKGSVGLGIPGTVTAETGLVKNANSVWLNGRPLQRDLGEVLAREVRCSNDANCFTLSEATDGAAAGAGVVFGVILGTGCGGGLAVRDSVHAGPNGLSGEWGHLPLPWALPEEQPGPSCYCGRAGCLETWISGTGFEQDFARQTGRALAGEGIVSAMRAGDREAEAAFHRLAGRLARGLAMVVDLLDPDVIVLGGGLSNIDELYSGALENRIAEYTFGGATRTPVLRNVHGDSSGVRGAAWLWPDGTSR